MGIVFYGLLYLADQEKALVNLPIKTFRDQVYIYFKNAINLNISLRNKGIEFVLVTNQEETLRMLALQAGLELRLTIKEIPFKTFVPNGIRFYSAHYKFDLVRYLASLEDAYVGIIDLDILAINPAPENFLYFIERKTPVFYDISAQVIAEYGSEIILDDMKKLSPLVTECRWAGGEFLAGPPSFFAALSNEIEPIYNNYLQVFQSVYHQGDEMPMSVALEIMRQKGYYIVDVGQLGIVGRYWSVTTNFPQKPFGYYENCFLLHLPADKIFLANLSSKDVTSKEYFLRKYVPFLIVRRFLSSCKKYLKKLFPKNAHPDSRP